MIQLDNQTNFKIDIDNLEIIACNLTTRDIELILTDNSSIQELNREYRGKDYATDVLSFPIDDDNSIFPLGSIVISIDFVEKMALEYGHSRSNELTLLFIHGLLHLLGYDHEIDDGEMREEEERIIGEFNLPSSLIIRNS